MSDPTRHQPEHYFRLAVESAPYAVVMTDHEGRIVLVNSQTERLFGYERGELLGLLVEVLLPDSFRKSHQGFRGDFFAVPKSRPMGAGRDLLAQRKNGTRFPVEIGLNPVETDEGIWVLSSVVDITERKRAEATLRENEQRFRAIFQQAAVGVAQVNLNGEVMMVNDRYCEILGYTRAELVGRTLVNKTRPADFEAVLANRRRLLAGEISAYSMEMQCIRKSGALVWVRLYGSLARDEEDRPKYLIAVMEDVTQRKQAEAALQESEERFRNMADTAPVMIWVSDTNKRCNFVNKVWLEYTGRTLEQELGAGWAEGIHPDDLDRCVATYSASFDAHRPFRMEYRLRRADGDYRWVLDEGNPRFTGDGVFTGYIGSCVDITEVKRTQAEALANQKIESLGQLARGVAHDFSNLLSGILVSAELALSNSAENSIPKEELLRIRTAATRGGEIVRQLITYGGKENPAFEPIDLSLLVDEMLQLLKVSISKQATLEADLGRGLRAVYANPAQLRQVVMNLVTNASQALEERVGVIRVTTAPVKGDYLRLEVSDTGSGMTPEVQARIFDPFFTTKSNGHGLGLAAVQGIVRSHSGMINVVSALGNGTRFEVLLPCVSQPACAIPCDRSSLRLSSVGRL
jgi:two-component system, cell cycle sensor histidine kinase and response regulator CckA